MIIINYNRLNKTIEIMTKNVIINGGEGSGNFGHEGRPGKVGGSSEKGGCSGVSEEQKSQVRDLAANKKRSSKLICKDISKLDFIKDFHKQNNLDFEVVEKPIKENSFLFYESEKGTAKKPSTYYIMEKDGNYYYVRGSDHWGDFSTNLLQYYDDREIVKKTKELTQEEFNKIYGLNYGDYFLTEDEKEKVRNKINPDLRKKQEQELDELYKNAKEKQQKIKSEKELEKLNKEYSDEQTKIIQKYNIIKKENDLLKQAQTNKFYEMTDEAKLEFLRKRADIYGRFGKEKHNWNINDDGKGYKYGAIKIN